jgi:hypothetical protein
MQRPIQAGQKVLKYSYKMIHVRSSRFGFQRLQILASAYEP